MKGVKEEINNIDPKIEKLDKELNDLLLLVPNPPLKSVPVGKDEEENVSMRIHGEKPG